MLVLATNGSTQPEERHEYNKYHKYGKTYENAVDCTVEPVMRSARYDGNTEENYKESGAIR